MIYYVLWRLFGFDFQTLLAYGEVGLVILISFSPFCLLLLSFNTAICKFLYLEDENTITFEF